MTWFVRRSPKQTGPYIIAANEFGNYCLPRKALHRPACQAILKGEVWEAETIHFLRESAEGDIIHGGTFFGDFLPALSRSYEHVWGFEPNPDSYKCAEITVRLNDLANVSLHNAGMGNRKDSVTLCTESNGVYLGGGSYIVEKAGSTPIVPLDSIVPLDRKIGVIHLDVEGYEQAAVEGARTIIEFWRPLIVVETVPPILADLGYTELRKVNANHIFAG